MADKLGSFIPKMGNDRIVPMSLGTSLLKVAGIGLAGGLALIAMASKAGSLIEKKRDEKDQ